ncbi:NAD(P)/FAD-dependent oxidoreductase [Brachybacterium sacelli]|uniref:NADPH-dependent 2,4-dienoyl-CoA reductase/sulfur reductase-like enzyme n=1 Tax=Brachybacterium sacelli TaxID=173364 RepID=A0ABS4WY03_9MICO|nr:NADPH-dependent 2,4-dienoyl-CoA reductase/sulfur reductase-like enzyme [Brachybacterium sacelli]
MTAGTTPARIAIVGTGPAGIAAADALRAAGHDGEIVIVGEEAHAPYDRPPLSKQVLAGTWPLEKARLRTRDELAAAGTDLQLSTRAVSLDVEAHRLELDSGRSLPYDALLIASGVRARTLPAAQGLTGVHLLRGLDDALALRTALAGAQRVAVVGSGFLGAEVAAVCRTHGRDVTLIGSRALPMQEQVGDRIGAMIAEMHHDHGVHLELGVPAVSCTEADRHVTGVTLADGRTIPADLVVVAVGSEPAVDWLRGSAVPLTAADEDGAGGVRCDATGRAADDVWAIGDVAAWWEPGLRRHLRVEHRLTANEHALRSAQDILGLPVEHTPAVPYFWSDQFDLKLQSFGLPARQHRFEVVDGAVEDRRFVAVCADDADRIVGVVGAGMFKALRRWRQALAEGRTMEEAAAPALAP